MEVDSERWSDFRHTRMVEPTGFADRLDVRCQKRIIKNDPRVFDLSPGWRQRRLGKEQVWDGGSGA